MSFPRFGLSAVLSVLLALPSFAGQFRHGLGRGESINAKLPNLPAIRIGRASLAIDAKDATAAAVQSGMGMPVPGATGPVDTTVPVTQLQAALDQAFRESFTLVQSNGDAFLRVAITHYTPAESRIDTLTGDAGEARFVFGAVDPQTCQPLQFTAIFEYEVPRKLCNDIKAWAKRWKDLDQHPLGSPAFRAALQLITDDFTKANANPVKQNGSALGQLRTNEKLGPLDWQLREFRLSPANGGHLEQVTVKQTPANGFDKTPTLASFVVSKLNLVLAEKHTVPLQFPTGSPFLAAHADTPNLNWTWDQGTGKVIANRPARHKFALNTCNGCHGGEAHTILFKHIDVAGYTPTAAGLSKFLTGQINHADPADGTPARNFNDLKRRAADLDALLNSPCFMHPFMTQGTMVH